MSAIHEKVSDEGKLDLGRYTPPEGIEVLATRTEGDRRWITFECEDCARHIERRVDYVKKSTRCKTCANKRRRKQLERTCVGCGDTFIAHESDVKRGGGKYCSRQCWRDNPPEMSEEGRARKVEKLKDRKGEKNPFYRHGRYAGQKTKDVEREFNLRKKGESKCRVCGSEDHLNAHHAVPRSISPAGRLDLRNCLPLCAACHTSWHRGRPISRDHFTDDEWAFLETLIGPTWLDKRYPKPEDMADGYFWDDSGFRAA